MVKVYDKVHELKVNQRCPKRLKGETILRFEVSMKREAFLKKLDLDRKDPLYEILRAGYEQGEEIIADYRRKMCQFTGKIVKYDKAKETIQQKVKDDILQEQMLYLLKKRATVLG